MGVGVAVGVRVGVSVGAGVVVGAGVSLGGGGTAAVGAACGAQAESRRDATINRIQGRCIEGFLLGRSVCITHY
jgi:hypothetical protein